MRALVRIFALALLAATPAWADLSGPIAPLGGQTRPYSYILAQSGIPVIQVSSGSIGITGAVTLTTALPQTYANAYLCLPQHIISTTAVAGCYYATMSSATAGTAYTNLYTTGSPAVPASPVAVTAGQGAYTQTTSITSLVNFTIPANSMGVNGVLREFSIWSIPGNTNTKTLSGQFGGNNTMVSPQTTAANIAARFMQVIANRGVANKQVSWQSGLIGTGTTGQALQTVDTTSAVAVGFSATLNTSALDYAVLESVTLEILPSNP